MLQGTTLDKTLLLVFRHTISKPKIYLPSYDSSVILVSPCEFRYYSDHYVLARRGRT